MKYKHALIALVLLLVASAAGIGAAQALAPSEAPPAADCTGAPEVVDTGAGQQITVVCTVPKPPPVTETVTQTATATATSTVTATATATATVTPSASPSSTPTTSSPTPTVTPTVTATPTPTSTPTTDPGTWPGPGNTGVPAGTALTAYAGGCTITAPVTIDAKTIGCPALVVKAAGVVITRSKVNGRIIVDTDTNRSWSLTLTDSEVNADGIGGVPAITNGNVTIVRANIHGGHNGLQCEEHSKHCVLRDSWVHGQKLVGGDHLGGVADFGHVVACDGVIVAGVPACIEMTHNNLLCEPQPNSQGGGCTGDLNMLSQYGPLHGALIQNNFFGANIGSAFCTYGGRDEKSPFYAADHIVYRDNVFQRTTSAPQCAAFGPVTTFDSSRPGNVWANNTWSDGGTVAPAN